MTKRPYGQGRSERIHGARAKPEIKAALAEILARYGMSYDDWLEKKITEDEMGKLLRIQIRDSENSDTFRAVEIRQDGEREVLRDYGSIGEAARDNLNKGVKVFRGKMEITVARSESGEIG